MGILSLQAAANKPPHHYHHRYEFDLGSDDPELVKMLLVDDETKETSAANDKADMCWVKAARSIKVEGRTTSVIQSPSGASPAPSPVTTQPKRLQEVKGGMTPEAVMTGLGSEYRITKMADSSWMVQRGDEVGSILFKDGVVSWAGEFLPVGGDDAASFVQALFKALYPHTRPATDEVGSRSGIRNDNVRIDMDQMGSTPDVQQISFSLSDGSQYSILVLKPEKSDKHIVVLKKVWQ